MNRRGIVAVCCCLVFAATLVLWRAHGGHNGALPAVSTQAATSASSPSLTLSSQPASGPTSSDGKALRSAGDLSRPNLGIPANQEIIQTAALPEIYKRLNVEVKPLQNAPAEVVLRRQPKVGETMTYKQIVTSCDANGKPTNTTAGGTLVNETTGRITEVDPTGEVYTVEWRNGPCLAIRNPGGEVKLLDPPGTGVQKMSLSCRGRVIRSSATEAASSSKGTNVDDFPCLEYPEKPLKLGESWTVTSPSGAGSITASVEGYAELNGRACVVLKATSRVKTTMTVVSAKKGTLSLPVDIATEGRQYVDYRSGEVVAEDMVTQTSGQIGAAFGGRIRSVKQLVDVTVPR
jgi:hypothetical protein